jgi:hypothetical protein
MAQEFDATFHDGSPVETVSQLQRIEARRAPDPPEQPLKTAADAEAARLAS